MQTFLPYPSYRESAMVLDRQRLGKQRVEVFQILKTLHTGGGWSNHPAVRMWRSYEDSLILYGDEICSEWIARGYMDTCRERILGYEAVFGDAASSTPPPWLGNDLLHLTHQANLVRKNVSHYGRHFPGVEPREGYYWPVNMGIAIS